MTKTAPVWGKHPRSEYVISQFFRKEAGNEIVFLTCSIPADGILDIMVLSNLGVTLLHRQHKLQSGKETIALDCSNLPGGTHNVWLEMHGHQFHRSLAVEKKRKSAWEKLLRFFS